MCGIAGYFGSADNGEAVVGTMLDALSHRGPDASGVFSFDEFCFGHRRLSIIDLTEAANQPMHSKCGRYSISYNGEVYNHREISGQLDLSLTTTSDTEVILEAFAKWGPDMVKKLNGMFAIAILDKSKRIFHLFRDRLGIKPLFIYQKEKTFAFASEIKSMRQTKPFDLEINRSSIASFLHLGYIPEPKSIYKWISKFPAGHYGTFDGQSLDIQPYWEAANHITSETFKDEALAKEQLKGLLTDSVSKRLMSDVPFGTFLSGGIDSSLITALAQQTSSEKVKSFSIGFEESTHDESGFAKKVATHLGTDHTEHLVTESDAMALMPDMLCQYDEPFADSSAIPTMLVSKLARQEVTMTLSGDGGDELFHGYGAYSWAERLNQVHWKLGHNLVSQALRFGNNRLQRVAQLLDYKELTYGHIFSQEQYLFSTSEVESLLFNPDLTDIIGLGINKNLARQLTHAENQAFFDLNLYLKDDLLVKVDRASMRYSLETRVPLLDHRIVEFALNLSPKLKTKDGCQKYLLKQILYDFVPEDFFDRPKWGFSVPLNKWLFGSLSHLIDDYLSETTIKKSGLVDWGQVKQLVSNYRSGQNYLYNRVWLLIVLHSWHRSAGGN